MSFDFQVYNLHEPSGLQHNQIGHAWCQSIGYWGQRTQIWHLFQEIVMKNYKSIFTNQEIINSWHFVVSRMVRNKSKQIQGTCQQQSYQSIFGFRKIQCDNLQNKISYLGA